MPRLPRAWSRPEPGLGVDFGASGVRAVALGADRHGITLLGAGEAPYEEGAMVNGAMRAPEIAGAALARVLGRLRVRTRSAALAIGGPSVFIRRLSATAAADAGDGLEPVFGLREAVAREAARHLPFHIEDMEFDYEAVGALSPRGERAPVAPGAHDAEAAPRPREVVFAAVPKELVRAHRAAIRAAGREAARIDIEPFALFAAARLEATLPDAAAADPGAPLAIVEIGTSRASVHVFRRSPGLRPPDASGQGWRPAEADGAGDLHATIPVSSGGLEDARRSARTGEVNPMAHSAGAALGERVAAAMPEAFREAGLAPPATLRLAGAGAGLSGLSEALLPWAIAEPTPLDPLATLPRTSRIVNGGEGGPGFAIAAGLAFDQLLALQRPRGRAGE